VERAMWIGEFIKIWRLKKRGKGNVETGAVNHKLSLRIISVARFKNN
jgi:hypothetical protein